MKFSHTDHLGKAVMVDVGSKRPMQRQAAATGKIGMQPQTIKMIKKNELQKGDVLAVARVAAISGAKKTSELIPLCHNIPIDKIEVNFQFHPSSITITSKASCEAKTGIEMEALSAVAIAALTIYDMCKAVDSRMVISDIRLVAKTKNDIPR